MLHYMAFQNTFGFSNDNQKVNASFDGNLIITSQWHLHIAVYLSNPVVDPEREKLAVLLEAEEDADLHLARTLLLLNLEKNDITG